MTVWKIRKVCQHSFLTVSQIIDAISFKADTVPYQTCTSTTEMKTHHFNNWCEKEPGFFTVKGLGYVYKYKPNILSPSPEMLRRYVPAASVSSEI